MGTLFDPSQLVNPLCLYRGDGAFTQFNYLDFPTGGAAIYLQNTNGGAAQPWNGATQCTWAFTTLFTSTALGGTSTLFGNEDAGGNNECFSFLRNAGPDTGGNTLQINIASSLSDRGSTWGKFGNIPIDGMMSHFTTPANVASGGTKTPQRAYNVVVVYDGSLSGNANRLRCYVNGTLDPSPTFQGTIPAHLTSPANGTPFTLGYGLWQGARLFAGLWNVAVWPNLAFTPTQVSAYCQVARSSWPIYKTRAQLKALGVPAGDSNWYVCDEVSTGVGAVARLDSSGNGRTMTEVGGFVASNAALQWTESFTGDVAQSVSFVDAATPVTIPVVVAGDTASGKAALRFPLGANSLAGQGTLNQMQLGMFGYAGGNWPNGYDMWMLVKKDFTDIVTHHSEQNFSGADSTNGQDNNSYGTNCFAANSTEDFSSPGGFGGVPGSITTGCGNGLGDYNPSDANSHPGINFAVSQINTYFAGVYFVLREGFRPGTDVVSYIAVNGVTLTTRNEGENPTFAVPPKNFEDITSVGGLATCYCLGGTAGEWMFRSAALQGNIALFCLTGPGNSDDDRLRMDVWMDLYGGFTPPTPAAPAGLAATPSLLQVALSWGAVTAATAYDVLRSTTPGGEVLLTNVSGTSYADAAVAPGVTYYYKVRGLIETTEGTSTGGLSAEASATTPTIPAPANLTATASRGQIALSWGAVAATAAVTYDVLRSTTPGGEQFLINVSGTSYTDLTVAGNTTYYYEVRAVVGGFTGPVSAEASATTPAAAALVAVDLLSFPTPARPAVSLTSTGQTPYAAGSVQRFQASPWLNGLYWDVSGGSVTLTIKDPTGTTYGPFAATVSGGQVYYDFVVLPPAGEWVRTWTLVDALGRKQVSNDIAFRVAVTP